MEWGQEGWMGINLVDWEVAQQDGASSELPSMDCKAEGPWTRGWVGPSRGVAVLPGWSIRSRNIFNTKYISRAWPCITKHTATILKKVAQSHPTLCGPMDDTVHGILQATILEWVAFSLLQGNLPNPGFEPRSPPLQVDSLPAEPPGKPKTHGMLHKFMCHPCTGALLIFSVSFQF